MLETSPIPIILFCVHVLKLICNLAYYSHSSGKMCLFGSYSSIILTKRESLLCLICRVGLYTELLSYSYMQPLKHLYWLFNNNYWKNVLGPMHIDHGWPVTMHNCIYICNCLKSFNSTVHRLYVATNLYKLHKLSLLEIYYVCVNLLMMHMTLYS